MRQSKPRGRRHRHHLTRRPRPFRRRRRERDPSDDRPRARTAGPVLSTPRSRKSDGSHESGPPRERSHIIWTGLRFWVRLDPKRPIDRGVPRTGSSRDEWLELRVVPDAGAGRLRPQHAAGGGRLARARQPGSVRGRLRQPRLDDVLERPGPGGTATGSRCPGQAVFDHEKQQVAAVSRAPGNLDLFIVGLDNHVWTTYWNDQGGWSADWFPVPGQAVFDHEHTTGRGRLARAGQPRPVHRRHRQPRLDDVLERPGRLERGLVPGPRPGRLRPRDNSRSRPSRARRATSTCSSSASTTTSGRRTGTTRAAGARTGSRSPGQAVFDHETTAGRGRLARAGQPRPVHRRHRQPRLDDLLERPGRLERGLVPGPRARPSSTTTHSRSLPSRAPRATSTCSSSATTTTSGRPTGTTRAAGARTGSRSPARPSSTATDSRSLPSSRAPGNLDLFIVGNDNHIWSTWWGPYETTVHPADRQRPRRRQGHDRRGGRRVHGLRPARLRRRGRQPADQRPVRSRLLRGQPRMRSTWCASTSTPPIPA